MENEYPSRVTLYEDGVYRWSYDMDMWHNRYMIRLVMKILLLMLGIPTLFVAAMLLRRAIPLVQSGLEAEKLRFFLKDDFLLLAVVGGMLAGMALLAEIIYAIAALAMKGTYRLRFQMDDTAVALVRLPGSMKATNALGTAAVVVGLLAGKPGETLRVAATLAGANAAGTSRFASTRRVKTVEACDVLDLREWFGMNQIYVPKEDFPAVRTFILARIPEKARQRSEL